VVTLPHIVIIKAPWQQLDGMAIRRQPFRRIKAATDERGARQLRPNC